MKRFAVLLVLLASVAAFAGAAPLPAQNEAYVILNGTPMYQDKDAKLTWVESLTVGDKVTLLNKTSKFKLSGVEADYVRVRALSGKEGWILPLYVSSKSSLAVVKADKAVVYSEPRDVKVTSRSISGMTVVAVLQDGSTGTFAKIQGYDPASAPKLFLDSTFVSVDDLTTSDVDINAAILYAVATASKDTAVKQNLLKVAINKYGGTIFLARLQAAAGLAPVVEKEVIPSVGTYVVGFDNVNVRATPDEKNGKVIGQLNKGQAVDVSEVTSQNYTIGANTAPWYHLVDPDGWVFGASLEPQE